MGEYSSETPLLSNGYVCTDVDEKKSQPLFKSIAKWSLKLLIWVVFVAWILLMFVYPSQFMNNLFLKLWVNNTEGTFYGLTGSLFFAFTAPVLILTILGMLYLIITQADELKEKKPPKCPSFRLWTFPVLVNGPFGVVTAAELIGILLILVFVIWACAAYVVNIWSDVSAYKVSDFEKSCFMLEMAGTKFGLIGLFCLSLLFLPVSRGSTLLRLIDIPFEHAARYHVWLGHLTMVIFTLHGLLHVISWNMKGQLIEQMLEWKDIGVANLAGVISLAAGIVMWVTSLPGVRRWNFELFFYSHQLYIVFVIFLAFHVGDFIFCMGAGGIFLFILDRFLRFIQSRKTVDIISATSLPCGTVELVLSKPACLWYNALSFIFLQVRQLSWLQWHPFSVSSSPLEGKYHLSVLIKVFGEWTDKLKGEISKELEEPQELLEAQLKSVITASVEGPYGHESPYYLGYKNLVLVAGGIGIAPVLAVLSDAIHRLKEGRPCLTKNFNIVWAIKKSDELQLLSMINMDSIDPFIFDALDLDVQIYVTRESQPKMEEGNTFGTMKTCTYPISKRSAMSILVGTGDTIWSGIYMLASSVGFLILLGLVDVLYINPKKIETWWLKGFLVLTCMLVGVLFFGGLIVALWHLWERKMLALQSNDYESVIPNNTLNNVTVEYNDSRQEYLINSSTLQYGRRPDFKEIFESLSVDWGAVDVGVMVCGPETLTSSVAKEIRSHSLRRKHNYPIFHFNSHSFDL